MKLPDTITMNLKTGLFLKGLPTKLRELSTGIIPSVVMGAVILIIAVATLNITPRINRGGKAHTAAHIIRDIKHPLLTIKQMESQLLLSENIGSDIARMESSVTSADKIIEKYIEVVRYDRALTELTLEIKSLFNEWVEHERHIIEHLRGFTTGELQANDTRHIAETLSSSTESYLLVMDRLDKRYIIIHAEIDDGRRATQEFMALLFLFFLYATGVVIFHQSAKTRELRLVRDGLTEEITERIRVDKALRESEGRVRLLLESTAEAIYGVDTKGLCTFANTSCLRLLGYKNSSKLIGRNMHKLIHHTQLNGAEYPEEKGKIFQPFKEEKCTHIDNELLWRSDNTSFPAEYWSHPIWSEGKVLGSVVTFIDITERKRAEESLVNSQKMLRSVLDTIPVRVFWKDRSCNYIGANTLFVEDSGLDSMEELIGKSDFDMTWKNQAERYRRDDLYIMTTGEEKLNYEEPQSHPDGSRLWLKTSKIPLRDNNGKIVGILGSYEDITEKKIAEEKIKASLKEKELLLKEVHHRVKNNLQIISSLLNLRSDKITDKAIRDVFKESQDRIGAMTLVHESLYQSESFSEVDFGNYVENLMGHLKSSYGKPNGMISLESKVRDIPMSIETAIPCGLIINELVTNSLKHAFPNSDNGHIVVSLETLDKDYTLTIKDDGIGIPETITTDQSNTLGIQLVDVLARQIGGKIEIKRDSGTEFKINFKKTLTNNKNEVKGVEHVT